MAVLKNAWQFLTKLMQPVGDFISRWILMPVLYFVLGLIFTGPARLGDPLRLKRRSGSHWLTRSEPHDDLPRARNMY